MGREIPRWKTVLITGGSGGIGYALAREFARDGSHIVLVSRDPAALAHAAKTLGEEFGITTSIIPADLSRQDAPPQIVAELQRRSLNVDVLVNNAGFGTFGSFADADPGSQLAMMNVNIFALTHLTKLLLPEMLERRSGAILNVASTAAFQPGPLMAVYYATKAYVLSFSEALANELQGTGVAVSALCPGPTATGFQKRAAMEESGLVKGRVIMDAATVARVGYNGLKNGDPVIIPGFINKLMAWSTRVVPRKMATAIVRSIQETRR